MYVQTIQILSSNRLNHISRKSISSTSQHYSNVQEVTQTDADDDDFRGSSTLSVSGEKEEISWLYGRQLQSVIHTRTLW